MNEPIKKPNHTPESYSPEKPEVLNMAEQAQKNNAEKSEVFVSKNTIEIVTINEEIKMVGLSFAKCTQTGSFKVNSPFDLYSRDSFALQEKINNVKHPKTCYAVWQKDVDAIVGNEVTDFGGQEELFVPFTIPTGKYAKVSWNAETFSELVMDAMKKSRERSGVDVFLENNNFVVPDDALHIEVYPHEMMCVGKEHGPEWAFTIENVFITTPITQYPEMYTLMTVKDKN